MASNAFTEGVKPGGLTTNTEIRILLCYLLDSVAVPISREQLEQVLLGEELVNYFAMADSLSQLVQQGLILFDGSFYSISDAGRTVAQTLGKDVPRTVRDAAVRGVIRAQQYAAKQAAHHSEVLPPKDGAQGRTVTGAIGDETGPLFRMELYMPDTLTAEAVRQTFIQQGDNLYKLMLAALTGDIHLANTAMEALFTPESTEEKGDET